jgi:hypothetical protein
MASLDRVRAQHLRDVTIHELSHAFTVLPRSPGLLLTLNVDRLYGRLPGHKAWDGRVTVKVLDEDRYQDSVYGWAGTVGEAIESDRPNAVEVAWKRYECSRQTLSDTDLKNIESVAAEVRRQTEVLIREIRGESLFWSYPHLGLVGLWGCWGSGK